MTFRLVTESWRILEMLVGFFHYDLDLCQEVVASGNSHQDSAGESTCFYPRASLAVSRPRYTGSRFCLRRLCAACVWSSELAFVLYISCGFGSIPPRLHFAEMPHGL